MLRIVLRDRDDIDRFCFIKPLIMENNNNDNNNNSSSPSASPPRHEAAFQSLINHLTINYEQFLHNEPKLKCHGGSAKLICVRNLMRENNHDYSDYHFTIDDDIDACNIAIDDVLLVMENGRDVIDMGHGDLFDENVETGLKRTKLYDPSKNHRFAHGAAELHHIPIKEAMPETIKMSKAPAINVDDLFSFNAENPQDCENFRSILREARSHAHMFVDITSSPQLVKAVDDALSIIKGYFDWPVTARQKMQMDAEYRGNGWNLMKDKRKDMLKIRLTNSFEKKWNSIVNDREEQMSNNGKKLTPSYEEFHAVYESMHKVGSKLVANMYRMAGVKNLASLKRRSESDLAYLQRDLQQQQQAKKKKENENNITNNEDAAQPQNREKGASSTNNNSTNPYALDPDARAFFDPLMQKDVSVLEASLCSFFECFRYNNFAELQGSEFFARPCEEHCDIGMTTISCESSTSSGLQVYSYAEGEDGWVDVEARMKYEREKNGKKYLSVMFGDFLHYSMNTELPQTSHRVIVPPSIIEPRYSFIVEAIPYPTEIVHVIEKGSLFSSSHHEKKTHDGDSNHEDAAQDNNDDDGDNSNSNSNTNSAADNFMMTRSGAGSLSKSAKMQGYQVYMDLSRGIDSVNWTSNTFDKCAANQAKF